VETNQIPDRDKRQFWQEQFVRWQASNLSKAAFCQQAALKVTTFYYWCKVALDLFAPQLFVFRNRAGDKLKVLYRRM
jgi:hypothetical protein